MRDVSLKKAGIILKVNLSRILLKYQKYKAFDYVLRFKCSSTQKRDCLCHEGNHSTFPERMTEPFFYKYICTDVLFLSSILSSVRQIHFVLPLPLKKKGKRFTDGPIKKESIHCFSMKICFYEGRLRVTRTKRQSDSC